MFSFFSSRVPAFGCVRSLLAFSALLLCVVEVAHGEDVVVRKSFSIAFADGEIITGTFTGQDVNNDGTLLTTELSYLALSVFIPEGLPMAGSGAWEYDSEVGQSPADAGVGFLFGKNPNYGTYEFDFVVTIPSSVEGGGPLDFKLTLDHSWDEW